MSPLLGAGNAPGVLTVAEGTEGEAPSRVKRNTFAEEQGHCLGLEEASRALH